MKVAGGYKMMPRRKDPGQKREVKTHLSPNEAAVLGGDGDGGFEGPPDIDGVLSDGQTLARSRSVAKTVSRSR